MQYRRTTEVIEDDNKIERPSRHSSSANPKILKGAPDRGHVFVGPKTPAEADSLEDDVTQFKRVHIVAALDTRRSTATFSSSESTLMDGSVTGTDLASDIDNNRRPPLPAPTESIISIRSTDSGIDAYSIPDDGTSITIRTSRVARLPAPYHSIVNGTDSPGERTLTPLSRGVAVHRYDDAGPEVMSRILLEGELAVEREPWACT